MLRRFKLRLAIRFEHPLVRLLILDWRFTCLLVLLMILVSFGVALPLRIWQRTPPSFTPEIRISALDFIQARALAASARKAEEGQDLRRAIRTWELALANDPCDPQIAAGYINALLRSNKPPDLQRGLQVALWRQSISPDTASRQLVIIAADRNEEWDLVQEMYLLLKPGEFSLETQPCILKALFRRGRYPEAKRFLNNLLPIATADLTLALYREALDCVLNPRSAAGDCGRLRERLRPDLHDVGAHELFLLTCAEKRDLAAFQDALTGLKQLTGHTLPFDILHVKLLLESGRRAEARNAAARLRAPKTGAEAADIAETLLTVGNRKGAGTFLAGYSFEFDDFSRPSALYARLLLQQGMKRELRGLRRRLQGRASSPASQLLVSGIELYLNHSPAAGEALVNALNELDASSADLFHFAAETLLAAGRPEDAYQALRRIEGRHGNDLRFYAKLFVTAEACKDAARMRRIAERSYQLAPTDARAAANYAAMLVMCDEQNARAIELTASCLKADPSSAAAKVNYAGALINAASFGAADLILREIDESALSNAARNQLRFIRLKRAVKLRDASEIARIAPLLDKSTLYSVQVGWLTANSI